MQDQWSRREDEACFMSTKRDELCQLIYRWAWFFLCSTLICYFNAAAIISVGNGKLKSDWSFHGFSSSNFYWKVVSQEHFYCVCYLGRAFLLSPAQTAPHAAPCCLTHNTNTYKYRHIQNSLTLSVPLPLPSLLYTQTDMHKRFFAICMRQYERITQARKGKAELDYSGSLRHEKPTDKFLSPTTGVRMGLSNNRSYTHAYAHSQAWNTTWFAW